MNGENSHNNTSNNSNPQNNLIENTNHQNSSINNQKSIEQNQNEKPRESKVKITQNPKKFLFVSEESLSGDLAWQIQKEGHEVKAYIAAQSDKDVYDGILDKVEEWESHIDWADVIVFDDVGFGKKADDLRSKGKLIVGGSRYTDELENDREFGQKEMERVGMNILPHYDFTSFESAIEFIKQNPGRYVFKPSGNIASAQKGILFLGEDEDGKDLLQILEQNKKLWAKKIKKIQLQKRAVGVEVAVGAFFNGKDFTFPINVNFEHKKLFPGDLGPYTGEMGTLMYWSQPNEIFNKTLLKIKEDIVKSKYVGYIDINCIANSKGIFPLEFTCRFGYPTISIQMEGIQSELGEFFYNLAKGETMELKTKKGFQIGVVIAIPPFPFDDPKETFIYKDLSIMFKKPTLEGIHIGDVKIINDNWTIAGESGYALVVTGSGNTVEEARKQTYKRVKNIMIQNMYYRTDIGQKWSSDSDMLHTEGYLYGNKT